MYLEVGWIAKRPLQLVRVVVNEHGVERAIEQVGHAPGVGPDLSVLKEPVGGLTSQKLLQHREPLKWYTNTYMGPFDGGYSKGSFEISTRRDNSEYYCFLDMNNNIPF